MYTVGGISSTNYNLGDKGRRRCAAELTMLPLHQHWPHPSPYPDSGEHLITNTIAGGTTLPEGAVQRWPENRRLATTKAKDKLRYAICKLNKPTQKQSSLTKACLKILH